MSGFARHAITSTPKAFWKVKRGCIREIHGKFFA